MKIYCAQANPKGPCAYDAGSQIASEGRISPRYIKRYPSEIPIDRHKDNVAPAHQLAVLNDLLSVFEIDHNGSDSYFPPT